MDIGRCCGDSQTAQPANEFSPCDVDCHATLPRGDIYLQDSEFVPKEGARVWISDGDLEEMGTPSFRERG
jgi:hypothetical protein